jgi:hypothetical protein
LLGEARKTAAVLGHNYPGNEWYMNSYELMENKKISNGSALEGKKVSFEDSRKKKAAWYELW